MLQEKGYHTHAKRKIQQLKNKQRLIKFTQNAFFITLTHYNASHEGGGKRQQSVTGNGHTHTYNEKNKTLKKHQHRIIKHTHDVFSFTLTHYTASHDR